MNDRYSIYDSGTGEKHWADYISCFKYSCDNVEERNEYQNETMTRKKWLQEISRHLSQT